MKTILLAELDGGGREWLAAELRNHGYKVATLDEGLALPQYLQFAVLGLARMPWPDLIVTDVQLEAFAGVSARRMFVLLVPSAAPESSTPQKVERTVNLGELPEAIASCLQS